MKKAFFLIIMFITLSLYAQAVDYVGPDFAQGIYDQYSKNFLNADMTGRGHTGMALSGGADYGIHNPASMIDDYSSLNFELFVKGNVKELNEYDSKHYQSPFPISFFGLKFKPFHNTHFGISYSLANSMEYYSFLRSIPQIGNTVDYIPRYQNYQLTFTTAQKINEHFSIGINTLVNMHNFREYRNEGKVDLLKFNQTYFRLQPGFLYTSDLFNVGASYVHSCDVEYQHKYIDYKMTIPSELKTGICINLANNLSVLLDTDYTLYSEQADYMNDQVVLKTGIEKKFINPFRIAGDYSLKAGFIYSPEVFKGTYNVPNFSSPDMDEFHPEFYQVIPSVGKIKSNNMGLLTMGTSIRIKKDVELNLAYLTRISGDINMTQFMSSLKFDLAVFNQLKK